MPWSTWAFACASRISFMRANAFLASPKSPCSLPFKAWMVLSFFS